MKIYIMAPAYRVTGGPELLHQLCAELRSIGFSAYMLYAGMVNDGGDPQPLEYKMYNVPWTKDIHDDVQNIIICPEVASYIMWLSNLKRTRKCIWWLSVDNFYISMDSHIKVNKNDIERVALLQKYIKICNDMLSKHTLHLVQSQYAYKHCVDLGISEDKIKYLGDYLRDDFIENAKDEKLIKKQDIVAYNPDKGIEFTKKLMKLAPEIEWFPLKGLTPEEMSLVLMSSKVYIDFGHHPGMDRIPREAAISGCCVITGKRGSAAYYEDVPIPLEYKFDDNSTDVYYKVVCKIKDIINNYDTYRNDFNEYRNIILNQKHNFKTDVKNIFLV